MDLVVVRDDPLLGDLALDELHCCPDPTGQLNGHEFEGHTESLARSERWLRVSCSFA